jgi:hypothetical protein
MESKPFDVGNATRHAFCMADWQGKADLAARCARSAAEHSAGEGNPCQVVYKSPALRHLGFDCGVSQAFNKSLAVQG